MPTGDAQRQQERDQRWRVAILVATALVTIAAAVAVRRIPQDPAYHHFADGRAMWSIPNGLNVLSNVAFAIVGVWGLWLLLRGRLALNDRRERWPWAVFFVGVALTSVGSAWYHLAPSNDTLLWDRIPMAVAFMGLFAAVIAERVDVRIGLRLLGPLVLLGIAGVLFWYFTERAGAGDLRPYGVVQFYPVLAIPLVLVLFPRAYTLAVGFVGAWLAYGLAKLTEVQDRPIFDSLGGLVSGHTLKHLAAAAGIAILLWMLVRREATRPPRRALAQHYSGTSSPEPPISLG